jgi:hypothetical protein
MISSVNQSFFRPTRIIPSIRYRATLSLLYLFLRHLSALALLFADMFKRSFVSKDRAGKTVKVAKKKYDEEAKEKLRQKAESPLIGR